MIRRRELIPPSYCHPTAMALEVADATRVFAHGYRHPDEWGEMATPLAHRGFEIRAPPYREMDRLEHERTVGTRLGPSADGLAPQCLKTSQLAMRAASLWKAFPGKVGYPLTTHTDTCHRYLVMGYQLACAAESLLAHIVDRAFEGHEAPKKSPAQRAKAGYRFYCATPIHIAAPPHAYHWSAG